MIVWKSDSDYRAVHTWCSRAKVLGIYIIKMGFRPWVHDVTFYRIAVFGLVRRNFETFG